MQIKKSSNKTTYFFIAFALVSLLVFGLFVNRNSLQPKTLVNNKIIKANDATKIATTSMGIKALIEEDRSYLFKNDDLYVFAVQEGITPKITFAYKTPLTKREKNDLLFIHIYLKDTSAIKTPYYNITSKIPAFSEKIIVNGEEYQSFTKALTASSFKNGVIAFETIDHINLGRFDRTAGRSFIAKEIKFENITIDKNFKKLTTNNNTTPKKNLTFRTLNAYAKESNFKKIRQKRENALENGILLSSDEDYIKGSIGIDGENKLKTDFRLKGDWTDHLSSKKQWSYRFILKVKKPY